MVFDKSSDEFDAEYDVPRPDAANAPAPAPGAPGPAEGAGGFEAELPAVFAAALADEPPSAVTAQSVLREVHGARSGQLAPGVGKARFLSADWFAEKATAWKWGGGLAVAAAAVGAVIVIGPMLGGESATSADMAVAGGAMPSVAAAGGSSSESSSDSGGAAGSAEARMGPDAAGDSSAAGLAADAAPAPAEAGAGSAGGEAYSVESAQSAPESSAAAADQMGLLGAEPSSQKASEATTSAGQACSLQPLTGPEWTAVVSALPPGIMANRLPGAGCQPGALRGNGLDLSSTVGEPAMTVWIVISDVPIGRDGAAADSTVVSAPGPAGTVTLIANQSGPSQLSRADLQRMADAAARAG